MQSKYIEYFGDLIVSGGVIFGLWNAGDIVNQDIQKSDPVATVVAKDSGSETQLSVTTEKRASESNIVLMCVSLGMGISFLAPRMAQAWKELRQADSETTQAKLANLEAKRKEDEKEWERERSEFTRELEYERKNNVLLREQNESLSKTIVVHVNTIAELSKSSSPVVVDTTQQMPKN